MATPILVTGGTGTLGRHVVALLREAGRDVRLLSRGQRASQDLEGVEPAIGDLSTGEGVDVAVGGVEIVVHCAGSTKGDGDKARHLVRAAAGARVRHLINISVVGADRVPVVSGVDRAMFGYFASKLDAERVVAESGLPWTTLRATQFHDLSLTTVRGMAKLRSSRCRPASASSRSTPERWPRAWWKLALGPPAGLVPGLAGPRVYEMGELLRSYLLFSGKRRLLVPMRVPGRAARAMRSGANLAPDRAVGRRTWEDFLAAQVAPCVSPPSRSN